MSVLINILLFILILGFIIFVHELGHFTWAKIFGVYVYEFALGMGPKLISKKGKETVYSLRLIPIGGFCQLAGEDIDDDDKKKVPKNRRLQDKSCGERFLIMFFGAGNNFISAFLILFFISLIWGASSLNPIISEVTKDSAAYKAGLKKNDEVIQLNNHKIKTVDDLSLYIALANPKKASTFVVERDGKEYTIDVKPKKIKVDGEDKYQYGIGLQQEKSYGLLAAIKYTYQKSVSLFKQMIITLGSLVTGGIKLTQLSGPVGIYSIVGEQSKAGLANILFLVAYLSINVGFINLLPLPAFDGGHIVFIIIEKIKGSPVSPEVEARIHTAGMIALLLLMLIITISDIVKLF